MHPNDHDRENSDSAATEARNLILFGERGLSDGVLERHAFGSPDPRSLSFGHERDAHG